MKRFTLILVCLLMGIVLAISTTSCKKVRPIEPKEPEVVDPEPEPEKKPLDECVLSIMSFNVAVDNRSDATGWSKRKEAVLNMLSKAKPMVIGFQEAQAHEITDMSSAHPEYEWYGLGRETAKRPATTTNYSAEEAMVVFWLKDSLNVLDKGTFWLSETPEQPGMGWDAKYPRTLTWVKFQHKGTGLMFFMFNTHLDNSGKTARSESMKLIANRMKELNPDNLPAFLTADFNTKSTDSIFTPINSTMKSTRDMAPESESSKMTYNKYSAPKSQIDHIFYLVTNSIKPLTFKVLDQSYGSTWISDHFPIVGTFLYTRQAENN